MKVMDRLISGTPVRMQSPDVLIGLAAWHIFPDISFLGRTTEFISFKDPCTQKGGILTIGMQGTNPAIEGIQWTLPLAHYQYYGKPKIKSSSISTSSMIIPFNRLIQVAIGSAISQWGATGHDLDAIVRFLIALGKHCSKSESKQDMNRSSPTMTNTTDELCHATIEVAKEELLWPKILAEEAESYVRAREKEKEEFRRFVDLGRRRFATFLAPKNLHPSPAFGLCDMTITQMLPDDEELIPFLRRFFVEHNFDIDVSTAIIMRHGPEDLIEFATLAPQLFPDQMSARHQRWVLLRPSLFPNLFSDEHLYPDFPNFRVNHTSKGLDEDMESYRELEVHRSIDIIVKEEEPCGFVSLTSWVEENEPLSFEINSWDTAQAIKYVSSLDMVPIVTSGWKEGARLFPAKTSSYSLLFGDDKVRVYTENLHPSRKTSSAAFSLSQITTLLGGPSLKTDMIQRYISRRADEDYFMSLDTLKDASAIYSELSGATVNLSVCKIPLTSAKWYQAPKKPQTPKYYTPAYKFACIAMFESGILNLEPSVFADAIAISLGNSLYVSQTLLRDPYSHDGEYRNGAEDILCLLGNVAKPGLSILILVNEPRLKEAELESWDLINHNIFNGKLHDSFRNTSLQLSFTGYETPVDTSSHGTLDKEAFFIEAVVSVHEAGKWVGDVDILKMETLFSLNPSRYFLPRNCCHRQRERTDASEVGLLTSIDSWAEFLDPPANTAVIRARKNWPARLAFAAATLQQKRDLLICEDEICFCCVWEYLLIHTDDHPHVNILC